MSGSNEERQSWGNKLDFILSTVGYAVGLGNIWRFPYLCYKSGGGAFLIPYFLMLIFVGIPLMIMESAVGQYTREGPVGAMRKICPLLTGTGLGVAIMSFLFCLYYNVVIAWALYYLYITFASISSGVVPWAQCHDSWSSSKCWDNYSVTPPNDTILPSDDFYWGEVLQKSEGIENLVGFNVPLLISLAVAWALVYLALFKGIRWTGKVVYFTALFPYLLLIILMIYGATLPGSLNGVSFFITPKWELLKNYEVWVDAAIQNFGSIGIGFGGLITFSSYNKFHNKIVYDCLIVAGVNSLTSLLAGFTIFSFLGFVAHEHNTNVDDVVSQGPGLAFILYPAAIANMPAPHFWAVAFFFMLLLLGIDSQFATLEVILTTVEDSLRGFSFCKKIPRELKVLGVVIMAFIFGLPLVTKGGIYVFELLNIYASGISLMYLAFFETIAIVWIYGAHNLASNISEMMPGFPIVLRYFLLVCWFLIAPIAILVLWGFSWYGYKQPKVGNYSYPDWAIGIGWLIAVISLIPIPIVAVFVWMRSAGKNPLEKLINSLRSPMLWKSRPLNQSQGMTNPGKPIPLGPYSIPERPPVYPAAPIHPYDSAGTRKPAY